MKLLHTSDLYLGKRRRGEKLRAQQRALLAKLADTACREQVDAVLLCGNICDNAAGLALLQTFAHKLAAADIPVYVVGGSADKLPLNVEGVCACDAMHSVTLEDDHGAMTLHMLPYMPPQEALSVLNATPLTGLRNVLMFGGAAGEAFAQTAFDYVAQGGCGVTVVELGALGDVKPQRVEL